MENATQHFPAGFPEENPADSNFPTPHQDDIFYLNEERGPAFSEEMAMSDDNWKSRFEGLHQLDALTEREETCTLLQQFHPDSLLELQAIGLDMKELAEDGSLDSLSNLFPAKARISLSRLHHDLILLLEAFPTREGYIRLKPVPYLKKLPNLPLSAKQKEAIHRSAPFLMLKRVVEPVASHSHQEKQEELWNQLATRFGIGRILFEEVMHRIVHQPAHIKQLVEELSWNEEEQADLLDHVNACFPLQLVFFTGLTSVLLPLDQLERFPCLQASFAQRLSA